MRVAKPFVIAGTVLTLPLFAGIAHSEKSEGFEGSASVGYVGTTGNTESQTVDTELRLTWREERWTHAMEVETLYTEQEEVVSGERYFAQGKSDYEYSESHYAYVKATYTDDRFTGFDYQATASAGYGHYFVDTDTLFLEAFSGVGYRYNAFSDDEAEDANGEGEAVLSLGENLEWELTDTASITQSLTSEIGEDRVVSRFEIAVVSTLIGNVATKIAFQARHTSDVPPDREKTDTQTSISLVYEF